MNTISKLAVKATILNGRAAVCCSSWDDIIEAVKAFEEIGATKIELEPIREFVEEKKEERDGY